MNLYPELSNDLRELHRLGIVISPWLANIGTTRLDASLFVEVELEINDYVLQQWTAAERLRVFGDAPADEQIVKNGIYEIVTSTAVYYAHDKTGGLDLTEETINQAFTLVQLFASTHGFSTLVLLYWLVTSWENMQALAYYKEIPESEFLLGKRHRPWVDYSIWDEVLYSCYLGLMQMVVRGGNRLVKLTDHGYQQLNIMTEMLENASYFSWRLHTLRISQLSQFDDFPVLSSEIWPDLMDQRRDFLDWSEIQPGMKVLELGCAHGVFTFDGGLAERVGSTGQVVAIDPSSGMIARANKRLKSLNYDWVQFQQGIAEELPFEDGTFDAVIGVAFLHFTDRPSALREMRRVVRPGGIVASFHPTKLTAPPSFFREWFSPLFEMAEKRNEQIKDYLPTENEVLESFGNADIYGIVSESANVKTIYHDPVKVVRHFIEGVGWFGEELSLLPWRARLDMIESLEQRGHEVCQRYSINQRIISFPNQMVKGYAPLS